MTGPTADAGSSARVQIAWRYSSREVFFISDLTGRISLGNPNYDRKTAILPALGEMMSAADLTTFFIMLREGLEASLIVGILLAYLRQVGALRHARLVWSGVVAAVGVSLAVLIAFAALGTEFDGVTEQVCEGS